MDQYKPSDAKCRPPDIQTSVRHGDSGPGKTHLLPGMIQTFTTASLCPGASRLTAMCSDLQFPDPPEGPPQATIWNTAVCQGAFSASPYAGSNGSQSSQKRDGDPLRQQGAAITSRPSLQKGGASTMRVPMVRPPCYGSRWETIRYALDSNARTFRLCLIWVVLITSSALAAAIAVHGGPGPVPAVMHALSWFPRSFR
jgi:hypothetical protein